MSANEDDIDQFCLITGAERELARNLLEACGHNLEMAVNMHMENGSSNGGAELDPVGELVPEASDTGAGPSRAPGADSEHVRAPIPQKQETLVQPGFEGYEMTNRLNRNNRSRVRSVFDGFRNFEEETRRRELEDTAPEAGDPEPPGYSRSKKRTLEDLFKPPLDIMFQGDWQSARDWAADTGRWLLVNIQEPKEFQCQVLNRDLWSNPGVKTIISEHFIFWQQYKQSDEAQRYMTFYKITQWPYIAVIDPRTGENIVTWSRIDANAFPELITEFLSLHPNLDTPEKPAPRKKLKGESLIELDEEAQIAAAIKASLQQTLAQSSQSDAELTDHLSFSEDEFDSPKKSTSAGATNGDSSSPENENSPSDQLMDRLRGEPSKPGAQGEKLTGAEGTSWRDHLGPSEDPSTNILIRFPDGTRLPWNYPSSSKLRALVEFISSQGHCLTQHEIVTNFPRRIISELDQESTLKEHNLFPRETVFVQLKD